MISGGIRWNTVESVLRGDSMLVEAIAGVNHFFIPNKSSIACCVLIKYFLPIYGTF